MNEFVSRPRIRTLLSWVEIILGIAVIGFGAAYFIPVVRDAVGDPHGMGEALGLTLLIFGSSLAVSGFSLRARGSWPWLVQSFPVLVIVVFALFLT